MRARLGLVLLVLFIAADVVLIPMAFRHLRPERIPRSADAQSPTRQSAPSRPHKRHSKPPAPRPIGPLFMVTSGQTVVTASHGDCSKGGSAPVVQVSHDGGASFVDVKVSRGLEQVLGLELGQDGKIMLTGSTVGCRVRVFRSDNGTKWRTEASPTTWHLAPQLTRSVIAPGERPRPTPCRPKGVSTVGGSVVRVLCSDSRILGLSTTDWVVLGRLDGARMLTYPTPARGLAIAPSHGCPSAVYSTDDGGSTWKNAVCIGDSTSAGIAGEGNRIVAVAGNRVLVSRDGGRTWAREF